MAPCPALQPGIERLDVATVDDGQREALAVEQGRRFHRHRYQLSGGQQKRGATLAPNFPLADREHPGRSRFVFLDCALREADREGTRVFTNERRVQQVAELLWIAGGGQRQPGHGAEEGQVEDTVMGWAVITGDPRSVEDE